MAGDLNKLLKSKIKSSGLMDFQGFKIRAFHKGQKVVDLAYGKTYEFYDIASLTKIVFTTPWFMEAVASEKLKLNQSVQSILPWYPHKGVKISQLLSHSAGNQWWQAFYRQLSTDLDGIQVYQQLESLVRKAPLGSADKAVYSDIDFYLLGSIMQKVDNRPLDEIWQRVFKKYYGQTQFHFNGRSHAKHSLSRYAPTEKCSWRKKTIRGQVHDENAWALGGVAPHAGLFGRIEDISKYALMLRASFLGERQCRFNPEILRKFSKRSVPAAKGDWGLGFMLPSGGRSSSGQYFHRKSFGHTGFTGTSVWYDPTRDLLVTILSNRVHPTRKQKGFVQLRPLLHDWIVENMEL